jgi:hypothetical protein
MGRPLWREDGSVFYNVQCTIGYTIYFTVSDLRAGPCIYIPQEQGGPVIPPGTGCTHTHTHTHTRSWLTGGLWLISIYDSRYIDATRKICHVIAVHCCVMSSCVLCIATVLGWTQRKRIHRIVACRVCWNVFTEPLPSNALRKSVTLYVQPALTFITSAFHPQNVFIGFVRSARNKQ